MRRSVAIVGAGPGGLSSAMLLAAAGADVTVYERGANVGGRSRRLEFDGYRFDTGPTFFLYPRIIEEIFEHCGFDFRREVEMKRIDPLYQIAFMRPDGGVDPLQVWADPARLTSELARFSPQDAGGFERFLADNRIKLDAFDAVLARPFDSLLAFLDPKVLAALRYLRPWKSLDQDLSRYFSDPRVRLAFSFQSKYLGMSPYRCPSLFSILAFLEHEHGVWHPTGGCNAVMDAMQRLARRMGVRVLLDTPVHEIVFEGRKAVGVRTDSGVHTSDAVVVNADFAHAMQKLVPDKLRKRWSDKKIESKEYSCSTFMLYLGIEGAVDLQHHTVLLADDYRANLREISVGPGAPAAPSLYVQNASRTDPTLAPPGHSALYVLVPVANTGVAIDWAAERPRFRALVIERLKALGLHDLESRIRSERIMTPADWQTDLSVFRGATFNLAHGLDQMLYWRPHNRFEELDGVYLVGGGTHPGSGLPVIFEGARITARLLSEDLGLRPAETQRAVSFARPGAPLSEQAQ
jgi:phytoene desaturase